MNKVVFGGSSGIAACWLKADGWRGRSLKASPVASVVLIRKRGGEWGFAGECEVVSCRGRRESPQAGLLARPGRKHCESKSEPQSASLGRSLPLSRALWPHEKRAQGRVGERRRRRSSPVSSTSSRTQLRSVVAFPHVIHAASFFAPFRGQASSPIWNGN